MNFRNPFRDGKAEAGAAVWRGARAGLVTAKEPLKDSWLQLDRNARAVIGDGNFRVLVCRVRGD